MSLGTSGEAEWAQSVHTSSPSPGPRASSRMLASIYRVRRSDDRSRSTWKSHTYFGGKVSKELDAGQADFASS